MRSSEIAKRYAKALYELSSENKNAERVFLDLRGIDAIIDSHESISDFFESPLITPADKEKALMEALKDKGVSDEVLYLMVLLAKKKRLGLFTQIVDEYEKRSDEAHNVVRGKVTSATPLSTAQRKEIESVVAKTTGKQVILSYAEEPSLIGGLVAEVGSFTFNDAIESHLNRINDELKRRGH